MAIYLKGALGAFSGKVGNLIGSKWRSIDYMRSRPRPTKRVASQKQLEARAKLEYANEFLSPLRDFIKLSYPVKAGSKHSAFDKLMSNVMGLIEGSYPNHSLRYEEIEFSKGPLSPVRGNFENKKDGILTLAWEPRTSVGTAEKNDIIYAILYHCESQDHYVSQGAERSDGIFEIDEIPTGTFHTWTMASNYDISKFSNSTYHRIVLL